MHSKDSYINLLTNIDYVKCWCCLHITLKICMCAICASLQCETVLTCFISTWHTDKSSERREIQLRKFLHKIQL